MVEASSPLIGRVPAHAAYAGTRVLVLGAAGFLGRRVVRALAAAGADLVAVDRAEVDLEAKDVMVGLVGRTRPAVVFNLVGYGVDPRQRDPRRAERLNAALPVEVADALCALPLPAWKGQRLVHVGSALEYGEAGGDLAEDTPPMATTLYGRSKLEGTVRLAARCSQSGLAGLTARAFMVYGPGELAGRLLPTLIAKARGSAPIEVSEGRQCRDFTYVDDIADGLLRLGASEGPPGQVVNLCTGVLTAVRDFVLEVARALEIPTERLRFGAIPTRNEEMQHDPVSTARLRERLAWVPTTGVEAGIRRTLGEIT